MSRHRVVTATADDGAPFFVHADEVAAADYGTAGVRQWSIWGTVDGGAVVGGSSGGNLVDNPPFPGPGGSRFFVVSLPPGRSGAFHTTDTVDYGVVLQGELVLDLGAGGEQPLRPGSCLVQRGTPHAWRNDGDEPVLAAFVMIGARRE
jgi:quercetin dioxygenase-like cupin family protein